MNLKLINKRRNNQIYADENTAYKIFNPGYSKNDVFLEAFITSKVESIGLDVPAINEVTTIEGKWAFKSELIEGKSLFDMMSSDPDNIEKYLDDLVAVQTNIHSKKCSQIPIQKQKLTDYIQLSTLDESLKIDLIDMLNSSPKHKKLCHGNLTPHNIIVSEGIFYVTDWNHATQGNASADVARTYLWMKMNMPDYAETYLEKFCEKTSTSSRYVHNWIPIVAASRLTKSNADELELLNSLISVIEY